MMFGGGMPGQGTGQGMGQGGGGPEIRIFHGGQGQHIFMNVQKPPPLILKQIQITLEQCYTGCSVPIEIERWVYAGDVKHAENETIYVTIPAGIDEHECILMKGRGNVVNDELKGDVKISIQIINNTEFKRQGLDIVVKKTITLKESLCGFSFELVHLSGKNLCMNNITNHTVIKPNFKKIIPTLGMNRENAHGNLIIEFIVEFPDSLTVEQITALSGIL